MMAVMPIMSLFVNISPKKLKVLE